MTETEKTAYKAACDAAWEAEAERWMRKMHYRHLFTDGSDWCPTCRTGTWPCRIGVLLATIDALRGENGDD